MKNLTVISLESRMALPMQRLIEKFGGIPLVAPSMQEIPLEDNTQVFNFYQELKEGRFDIFILLTGVATTTLIKTLEKKYPKEEILKVLSEKTKIVVRGPKPTRVCKLNNIPIFLTAPEPNTWREIIQILKDNNSLQGKTIGVLEYGISNEEFLEELSVMAKEVVPLQVYQWALPDDLKPLDLALDTIRNKKADLILFTSANQVNNMLLRARQRDMELSLRKGFYKTAVFSIGPVCSERLCELQFFPDAEASPNKLETLVELAAVKGKEILIKKRERIKIDATTRESKYDLRLTIHDSPLLRACKLLPNSHPPIWLMRQAGRYMAEYQVFRQKYSFKEMCQNPELSAQITLDAVERLQVDAAIIFSDILVVLEPMGFDLEYIEGKGPVIGNPPVNLAFVQRLKPVDVNQSLDYVYQAIRIVRQNLPPNIPLIGFVGAPFTVASYVMNPNQEGWDMLLEKITKVLMDHLNAQIKAGCEVAQIFDSWVNKLSLDEYKKYVLPYSQKLIEGISTSPLPPREGARGRVTPVIHFGTFSKDKLLLQKEAGGNVMGVHQSVEMNKAWEIFGNDKGVQGNLDPKLLFEKPEIFLKETEKILKTVGHKPGFIFNLGHGILPGTPVDHVMRLVDFVKEFNF